MKLKNQVCTLAQAKKLKELGVCQESLCRYVHHLETELVVAFGYNWTDDPGYECYPNKWAAFTVAELGEMLKGMNLPIFWKLWNEWCFKIGDQPQGYGTEATARAAMLIHLLEKGSLTSAEVNQRLQSA